MKAKTLVYKDTDIFVHVMDKEIWNCSLPELHPEECTLEILIKYYESIGWNMDFTGIELKTVEINILFV